MANESMSVSDYREDFDKNGYVHIKDFFNEDDINLIAKNVQHLHDAPEVPGKYMKYHETVNGKRQLARVEYFVKYYEEINDLFRNKLKPFVEQITGKELNIFKDKLNWKLAGGNGFKAHQDHPAWNDFDINYFVSLAVFADDCTIENGCLEMVKGKHRDGILKNNYISGGGICDDVIDSSIWEPVLSKRADLVIFDSYVPHKSEKNTTDSSRRIFYFTFNEASEGDYYEEYFVKKREEFPPDIERIPGKEYNGNSKYNLANPMSHKIQSETEE